MRWILYNIPDCMIVTMLTKGLIIFICVLACSYSHFGAFLQGEIWYCGDVQRPMELGKQKSVGIPVQALNGMLKGVISKL